MFLSLDEPWQTDEWLLITTPAPASPPELSSTSGPSKAKQASSHVSPPLHCRRDWLGVLADGLGLWLAFVSAFQLSNGQIEASMGDQC